MTSHYSNKNAELDPAFGDGGKLDIRPPGNFPNDMPSMTLDSSGHLLIFGSYQRETPIQNQPGVARLKENGAFDTKFGDNQDGFTSAPQNIRTSSVSSLAMLPNGTFFVTGDAASQLPLIHYDIGGKYLADRDLTGGQQSVLPRLLVTEDSKLLVAIGGLNGGVLYRRNDDGTPDPGFGEDGKQTFLTDSRYLSILHMSRGMKAASFYIAGEMGNDGFILRMKQTGEPDEGFAEDGIYRISMPGASVNTCRRVAELDDGRVLALITTSSGSGPISYLIRLGQKGLADATFNRGQPLRIPGEIGEDIAIQADGKILVAHRDLEIGNLLTRYLPDGLPDTGFGDAGTVLLPFADDLFSAVKNVVVQSDGKIVVAGTSGSLTTLLRLMP